MNRIFVTGLRRRRSVLASFLLCVTTSFFGFGRAAAQESENLSPSASQKPALTADQIVDRLQKRNRERELTLGDVRGTRLYHVQYRGIFGNREADAIVNYYSYGSPIHKEFAVVSQTGSKLLFDRVIKGLMDGEKEASTDENRRRTALNTENYDFTLAEDDTGREPSQYVLNVIPKNNNKFLYCGKIWVDANDFAVTRIDAEPAESPSVWVKKSEVNHKYEKVGAFWLPAENRTESWVRLGGHALLSIEYKDYKVEASVPPKHVDNAAGSLDAPVNMFSNGLR